MDKKVNIEIKLLTAKAGSNVKNLASQTRELKATLDATSGSLDVTSSGQKNLSNETKKTSKYTEQNTDSLRKNQQGNADLQQRLARLNQIYDTIIHSKSELNSVDIKRARSIKSEINTVENQINKNKELVAEQTSNLGFLKAKATSSLGKAGLVGLYASAGVAAASMMRTAIQVGREFEQQLADLEAITGITGDQLESLGERSLEISVKYGESASNIIEANKLVASQLAEKIDFSTNEGAAELAKISEEAIVLQKAAGVDLPTAVKTLTTAINQFNLPASESARIINSIAAGSKFGAAEVAEQAEAYRQSGAVAAGANLSFEQLNATVQVLAANAITGSQAGTNIRGVLLSLQNSAKLAEAGIEGVSLETEGYAGALQALKPLLNDTIALEKLFGRENIASARILIQNAESVAEMTDKVTGGNVAYQQAEVQLKTFNGSQARLSQAIKAQMIPAFQQSGGVVVTLMDNITELIQSFSGGLSIINDWMDAYSDARKEIEGTNRVVGDQIDAINDLREKLAEASNEAGLTAEQEQLLREAYEATTAQTLSYITPLQEKINLQLLEREQLQEALRAAKEKFGWDKLTEEQLIKTNSVAADLIVGIRELTMKIDANKTNLKALVDEYNKGLLTFDEFVESMKKSGEAADEKGTELDSLSKKYEENGKRISELINLSRDLTSAELEELQSRTKQNEALAEQIAKRKELAELGADLRPEVANPEPVHVPIEIDIDIPEIELDAPLRAMDDIIKELNKDVQQYVELSGLLGDHSTDNEYAIQRTEQAIQELITNGYHPQSEEIRALIQDLKKLDEKNDETARKIEKRKEKERLLTFAGEQIASSIEGIDGVNRSLRDQISAIKDRAAQDKVAAKTASERAKIEKRAQMEIAQAEKQAKKDKIDAVKKAISASITEAVISQFQKVITSVPWPLNFILAPVAAAAVKVGMNKLVQLNTGGPVPGPSQERKDTVPAMLTPGEFVIRKDSAAAAPNALPAINEAPEVAREVEQFLSDRKLTGANVQGYNAGGLVSVRPKPAAINNIINREIKSSTQVVQQQLNMDSLRDEIRTQTEEIRKMKLKTELSLTEFREQYDEYLEQERLIGR